MKATNPTHRAQERAALDHAAIAAKTFLKRSATPGRWWIEADDVLAEAAVVALRALPRFDASKGVPLGAYIFRCVSNQLTNTFLRNGHRGRTVSLERSIRSQKSDDGETHPAWDVPDTSNDPEVLTAFREATATIETFLARIQDGDAVIQILVRGECEQEVCRAYGLRGAHDLIWPKAHVRRAFERALEVTT